MKEKKRRRLKKFYFHPVTIFIVLSIFVVILSGILSKLEFQATYNRVNNNLLRLEPVLVTVENLFNYDGLKYIISNAARNFISFAPLNILLISLIGISVAESSGLINTFMKKYLNKHSNKTITFFIVFLGIISSLINEVGYAILIPLSAIVFLANKRNPLAGIVSAFCSVGLGYGVTLFVGSMEVGIIPYTTSSARLIDDTFHVSLTSNLFIIIAFSILLAIIGTIILEKWIIPKLGKYKEDGDLSKTEEIEVLDVIDTEQVKIEQEKKEKAGLRYALIAFVVVVLLFIYMIVPNLPGSGILLDTNETTYLNQLFGNNSYFQDGFTFMVSILLVICGIAYGCGAKTFKNDRDILNKASLYLKDIGSIIILMFVASQFIAIFKKANIGTVITALGANLINDLSFTGLPLIILVILVIAFVNLFNTTATLKWSILSPVVVPMLMQSNISPQFAQMLLRAGDSMTNCITPLLAFFVVYIGYLNIYHKDKEKPIGITKAIRFAAPCCLLMSLAWILLLIGWYLLGLPLGPNVLPTL